MGKNEILSRDCFVLRNEELKTVNKELETEIKKP
jgi:hypothetical protein